MNILLSSFRWITTSWLQTRTRRRWGRHRIFSPCSSKSRSMGRCSDQRPHDDPVVLETTQWISHPFCHFVCSSHPFSLFFSPSLSLAFRCGSKQGEEDYRPLFENFVHDLLSTVNKPDWPAAELLLSLLGRLLVSFWPLTSQGSPKVKPTGGPLDINSLLYSVSSCLSLLCYCFCLFIVTQRLSIWVVTLKNK